MNDIMYQKLCVRLIFILFVFPLVLKYKCSNFKRLHCRLNSFKFSACNFPRVTDSYRNISGNSVAPTIDPIKTPLSYGYSKLYDTFELLPCNFLSAWLKTTSNFLFEPHIFPHYQIFWVLTSSANCCTPIIQDIQHSTPKNHKNNKS